MVSAFKKVKVVEVESSKVHGSAMTKQKAEAAGLIAGTATGLFKKRKSPKVIYKPVKLEEPKMKIKYISVVKPVLVRVEPEKPQETLYKRIVTKEEKKPTGLKYLPGFIKGFFKGKVIGKAISKTL